MNNAQLKAKLNELQSCSMSRLSESYKNIHLACEAKRMASGVIIHITDLNGKPIIQPTMIADGLGEATVAALKSEFKKTQLDQTRCFKIPD